MDTHPQIKNLENHAAAFTVSVSEAGNRLDVVISHRCTELSRSHAGRVIRAGQVTVNDEVKKPGYVVREGDVISVEIPPPDPLTVEAEPLPLNILHEDSDIIVIDKPPGLVVHPGAGHVRGTLVNALLYHCHDLEGIGGVLRPGIVHRLDKDTSGCLVVAKNDRAHTSLSEQFKERKTKKIYIALVYGTMDHNNGIIDLPIGRHPSDRKKMSVHSKNPRTAETHWTVQETFPGASLLHIDLKTGRTHQIRVHLAAAGHPVVGDPTYGGTKRWKTLPLQDLQHHFRAIKRQMLHAWKLTFQHPRTGQSMTFEAALPEDMETLFIKLREKL